MSRLNEPAVLAWVDAGCSVIPILGNGTKKPAGSWKAAQSVRASRPAAKTYAAQHAGIGVVCGTVSGNLEMLELEGRAVHEGYEAKLRQACADNGLEHILDTLTTGLVTRSPSGGYHLWYRIDGAAHRNRKLVRRPATPAELAADPDDKVKVLIETRGEGGYAVVPPSNGKCHPTGNPWTIHRGSPATIPTITVGDRDALHAVASLLDEMPTIDASEHNRPQPTTPTGTGQRPGDAYNEQADWDQILTPHGWTKVRKMGSGWAWLRPGKDGRNGEISATTGQRDTADRLYIFTTSTELPTETPLSKFWVYTQLEHAGDPRAAAAALRVAGYGDPLPPRTDSPRVTTRQTPPPPPHEEPNDEHPDEPPLSALMIDGAAFILDIPTDIPAIWGEGTNVLWAQGEALIIAGGSGVGKTTISGQLVRARLGLQNAVLGLPVQDTGGRILYLAMDRPSQAQRALNRLFTEADRALLTERLTVWKGPPPLDLAKNTTILLEMCHDAKADTVIIDSLKDAAIGLSEDEVGAGWNRSRQRVLADDIQVLELHHNVKRGANGAAPNTLADVYGSAWITNGAGSVIGLHGEAGDVMVEMRHLKQPMEEIGPWTLIHDHDRGVTAVQDRPDVFLLALQHGGITASTAAKVLFSTEKPSNAQTEKARRKLRKLVESGHLNEPIQTPAGQALFRPRPRPDRSA